MKITVRASPAGLIPRATRADEFISRRTNDPGRRTSGTNRRSAWLPPWRRGDILTAGNRGSQRCQLIPNFPATCYATYATTTAFRATSLRHKRARALPPRVPQQSRSELTLARSQLISIRSPATPSFSQCLSLTHTHTHINSLFLSPVGSSLPAPPLLPSSSSGRPSPRSYERDPPRIYLSLLFSSRRFLFGLLSPSRHSSPSFASSHSSCSAPICATSSVATPASLCN